MKIQLTESELWFAERNSSGFLVALWLDEETSGKLALSSGEPADSLHITLAFCGDAAEMGELFQARAISAVDNAVRYWDPIKGKIAGYGRFIASESSDGQDVFYATPDIPNLINLRNCITNCLIDEGVPVSTNHGYTPHITLAYLESGAPNPIDSVEPLEFEFKSVTIMAGNRRVDVPFWVSSSDPKATIVMSETEELPLEAPLGSNPARPLYFGDFNKEWIPFLPRPGKYVHKQFGDLDFTSDTYTQLLQNFNSYVFKQDLPIRATHMPKDGGAVGWIKPGGMRLAEDGSIEVRPEWNELGKGLVEDDRFKYASAEFCRVWTNPVTQEEFTNVAVGLALVTRPHFKTDVLHPLSELEALAFAESTDKEDSSESDEGGEAESTEDAQKYGSAGEGISMKDANGKEIEEKKDTPAVALTAADPLVTAAAATATALPAVVLSDLTTVVMSAEQRKSERQMFADLSTRMELAERRATTAEGDLANLRNERLKEKFTAEVMGRSAENGVAWFGGIQENVSHLVSLAEKFGFESPEVTYAVNQKRNEARAIGATGLFDPISIGATPDGPSVDAQVARFAEQLKAANPKLTDEQASNLVFDQHPELYVASIVNKR